MGINVFPTPSSSTQQYEQIFIRSGTWTKPAGVRTCEVTVVGGGGGSTNQSSGGAGGYIKRIVDVSATSSVAITVGAGGSYGLSTPTFGGQSSFGSNIIAYGGNVAFVNSTTNITYSQNGPGGAASSGVSEIIGENFNSIAAQKSRTVGSWTTLSYGTAGMPINYCYTKNNGIYLATTYDASFTGRSTMTSTDGLTWTFNSQVVPVSTAQVTEQMNKIASVNGRFILTANGNQVYSSTNGTTWTGATLPISTDWRYAADNGTVAIVQALGSTSGAYSTNGTSWTSTTLPFNGDIGSAGPYLYSSNLGGSLSYSTNGTSWTACTGTRPTSARNIYYFPTLNRYFAFSTTPGQTTNWMSTNGIAWTSSTNVPTTGRFAASLNATVKTYIIDEVIFTHVYFTGDSNQSAIFMSVDGGQSWTEVFGQQFIRSSNQGLYSFSTQNIRALPIENGRHVMPWQSFWSGTNLYNPVIMFSNALTGGFAGFAASSLNNDPRSSAGSFDSNLQVLTTNWNGSAVITYFGSSNGGGSPEGFARGWGVVPASLAAPTVNYGDGAPANANGFGGGQGVVIVRWSA